MINDVTNNIANNKELVCIYCHSTRVIRHGKTTTGNKRFRCRVCGRTWVLEKREVSRPPISVLVEQYLSGQTCRSLVEMFHSSPLRINQVIREFLEGLPSWEEYLDLSVENRDYRLVYLTGKSFACACKGTSNNSMFLALAVDAFSNVVLGYEIGRKDSERTWNILLQRLLDRGISIKTFMTNGAKHLEEAVNNVYTDSTLRIFYHKVYRDRELKCCLSRLTINNKLINDAIKAYDLMPNHALNNYLLMTYGNKLKDIVIHQPDIYLSRLRNRLGNRQDVRIDGLLNRFQLRFERFHMLKGNPASIINGWIAREMTIPVFSKFSRLSLAMQVPSIIDFDKFCCGNIPEKITLRNNSDDLKTFVAEAASRSVELPIFFSRCEMRADMCSLFG